MISDLETDSYLRTKAQAIKKKDKLYFKNIVYQKHYKDIIKTT